MALKRILGILLVSLGTCLTLFAQQEAENYKIYYNINDVSCAGGDGAIRVDSFQCSVSNRTGASCFQGDIPATYSCNDSYDHILTGSGQTAYLSSGKTYKIDGSFYGTLEFHGDATVYICGSAHINNLNISYNSKIIVFGELITTGININSSTAEIINYGKISVSDDFNTSGHITNYDKIFCKDVLNLNSNTSFENYGKIIIGNSYEFGGTRDNYGTMRLNSPNTKFDNYGGLEVYNSFTINSQTVQFRNYCTLKVYNNVDINTSIPFENYGYLEVQQLSTWNTVSIKFHPGSYYTTNTLSSNNAYISNTGSECTKLKVNTIQNFNNNTFDGKMSLCFPQNYSSTGIILRNGAEKNCTCEVTDESTVWDYSASETVTSTNPSVFDIIWADGSNSKILSGLPGGVYEATVSNNLCKRKIKFQVKDNSDLTFQYSFERPGCAGKDDGFISINAAGGTPPYQYQFNSSGGWVTESFRENATAGNYQLNVKDANGCTGEEMAIVLADGDMTESEAEVDYLTCYADSNTARIIIEGKVVSLQGDTVINNPDTIDVDFSNYTCFKGLNSIPYSCSDGTSITSNSNYSIGAGNVATLDHNFSGWLGIDGGTLIICGDVTMSALSLNNPNDKVIVLGTLHIDGIYMNSTQSQVYNYGVIDYMNTYMSVGGKFYNYGTLKNIAGMNVNTGSYFENYGPLTVTNDLHINTTFLNSGPLTVGNYFGLNSGGILKNHCTINVSNEANFASGSQYVGFNILTAGKLQLNSGAEVILDNALLDLQILSTTSNNTITEVNIEQAGSYCSKIHVHNEANFNAFLVLNGNLSLCADASAIVRNQQNVVYQTPDAKWDCSCSRTTEDDLVIPGDTNSGNTGAGEFVIIEGPESDTVLVDQSGTYIITFRNQDGCLERYVANVRFPEKPSVAVVKKDLSCIAAMNDGEIKLVYDNAAISRSELFKILSPGNNRFIAAGKKHKKLFAGDYRIAFTSPEGCVLYDSTSINPSTMPCLKDELDFEISHTVEPVACDSFKVVISDESIYEVESYKWILPSGQELLTYYNELGVSLEGTYQIILNVRDENGIVYKVQKQLEIVFPQTLDFQFSAENSDPDENTGSIHVHSVIGNFGNVRYSGPSQTGKSPVFTGLSNGIYQITVSDEVCSITKPVEIGTGTVSKPCDDFHYEVEVDHITCFAANNGKANLILAGTNADAITGKWFIREGNGSLSLNKDGVKTIENLTPGDYEVIISISKSGEELCVSDPVEFKVTEPVELKTHPQVVNEPSYTDSRNGEIYVSVSGGSNPVISWSGENSEYKGYVQRTGLSAGRYFYTVIDDNNCIDTGSVVLNSQCDIISAEDVNKSCRQCNTAFELEKPASCKNEIEVTEADCNNNPVCTRIGIQYAFSSYECSSNPGFAELRLNVSGDLAEPVTVQKAEWFRQGSCEFITEGMYVENLNANRYEVYIELSVGAVSCVYDQTIILPDSDTAAFSASVRNLPCPELEGSVLIQSTGDFGPYQFSWKDPQGKLLPSVSSYINPDKAGNYIYTASSTTGCVFKDTINIAIEKPSCDVCDQIALNIKPGDISCHGYNDGRILLSYSNAFEAETLEWFSANQLYSNEKSLFGLSVGVYSLKADFKHKPTGELCHVEKSYTVNEPSKLSISASSVDICHHDIDEYVSGGTGERTYIWKSVPGENSSELTCISDGNFNVTVIDENKCQLETELELTTSDCDSTGICFKVSAENTSCDNLGGKILVTGLSGAAQYTITASSVTGDFSLSAVISGNYHAFTGVPAGKYAIRVEGGGYSFQKAIFVPSYFPPNYTVSINPIEGEECRVLAEAFPVGAVFGNYNFKWESQGAAEPVSSIQSAILEMGNYTLTVTDPYNPACPQTIPVEVADLQDCGHNDNDFNIEKRQSDCYKGAPVRAFEITGTSHSIDTVYWYFNGIRLNGIEPVSNITNIISGDSKTLVTSATNGLLEAEVKYYHNYQLKSITLEHFIFQNQKYVNALVSSGKLTCESESSVTLGLSSTVPSELLSFSWYKTGEQNGILIPLGETGREVTISSPGRYSIVVSLPDGCADTLYKSIYGSGEECNCSNIKYDVKPGAIGCNGETGKLEFSLDDGSYVIDSLFWKYNNQKVGADAVLSGLSQKGLYTLKAYVNTGNETCEIDKEILLESVPPIQVANVQGVAPGCFGGNDGYIRATINGGSGKYYFEDPSGNPMDISALGSGDYNVVVKDLNNSCQIGFSATVPEGNKFGNCSEYDIVFSGNLRICYSENTTRQEQMEDFKVVANLNPLWKEEEVVTHWEWFDADGQLLKTVQAGSVNELLYNDLLASALFTQTGPLYMELTVKAHFSDGFLIQEIMPIGSTSLAFTALKEEDIIINNPTDGMSGFVKVDITTEEFETYAYSIEYLGGEVLPRMVEKGPLFPGAVTGTYIVTKSDGYCESSIVVEVGGDVVGNNKVCEDAVSIDKANAVVVKADSDKESGGSVSNIIIQGNNLLTGNYFYKWDQQEDSVPLTSGILQFNNLEAGDYILQIVHKDRPECSSTQSFTVEERIIVSSNPTFTDQCGMVLNVYDYVSADVTEWRSEFGDPTQFTDAQKEQIWLAFYEANNVCRFYSIYDEASGNYTVLDNDPADDADNYGERVSLVPGEYDLVIGCNDDLNPATSAYEKAALPEDRWIEFIDEIGDLNLFPGRIACTSEETFLHNDFWNNPEKAGKVTWYYINASSSGWINEQAHSDQFEQGIVSADETTLLQNGWMRLSGDQWHNNRPRVSPKFSTVYGAIYTNGNCVTHNAAVVKTIGGLSVTTVEKEVCPGEEVTLDISESLSGNSYRFVEWTDEPGASELRTVTPSGTSFIRYEALVEDRTGLNSVTHSDIEGCFIEAGFEITILGAPVNAEDETIVACAGSTVQLHPAGGESYNWAPETGFDDLTSADQEFTVTGSKEYVVTITNEAGCSVDKKYKVQSHESFAPSVSVNPACLGNGKLQLDISEGSVLKWSPEPLSGQATSNAVFDLSSLSELLVTVEVENENNCVVEIEKEIASPGILSLISSEDKVCLGKPVQLFADKNVTWSPALGLSSNGSGNPYVYVTSTTTYTATGTDIYGCPFSQEIVIEVDESCLCYQPNSKPEEETYFWRGGAGYSGDPVLFDNNWDNLNNWSVSKDSYVIPSSLPDRNDNVVLEDLGNYSGQPVAPVMSHNVTLNNVCVLGNEWQLNNSEVRYLGNGIFSGGKVLASEGSITGDGTVKDGDNISYFAGTSFGTKVDVTGAEQLYLNGSAFLNTSRFEFTGNSTIYNEGGNIYEGETRIIHRGSGNFYLAYTPDGSADQYAGQVTFEQLEAGKLYISSTYMDEYLGNVYFLGNNFHFGIKGGGVNVKGESEQYFESATNQVAEVTVGQLSMNKPGFSSVNALVLNKVNLTIPGAVQEYKGILELNNGYIRSNRQNGLITLDNSASIQGGSQESFVAGPLRIMGSGTVTFPVGKRTRFMPLTLEGLSANINGNIIEFIEDDPLRADQYNEAIATVDKAEELKHLADCEFWLAEGQALKSSNVTVILSWDEESCDIPYDPGNLRLAVMENSAGTASWLNAGNTETTGSPNSMGTLKSGPMSGAALGTGEIAGYAFGASSDPGFESPTGFSFNSYGARLTVNKGSHLIVYGDVLNEYSGKREASVIDNKSVIKVEDDWTNNAFLDAESSEDVYVFHPFTNCTDCEGSVYLFGNNQRIRGTTKTRFHKLHLTGFGIKTMYVDAEVDDQEGSLLALNDNVLNTGMFNMTVMNTSSATITRENTGYVKSETNYSKNDGTIEGGLLIWNLLPGNIYKFPVGSELYYRPVEVSYTDAESDAVTYGLRLVEDDPENHGLYTGPQYRSPYLQTINRKYYHHISRIDEPALNEGVKLKFYFDRDKDGAYQSIAQWGNELPLGTYLGIQLQPFRSTTVYDYTPGVTRIWNVADGNYFGQFSDNANSPSLSNEPQDYIELSGHKTVNDPYYSLVRRGIVLQSTQFGDPDGDNGEVTYTVKGASQTTGNGGVVYQTESSSAIGNTESEQLNHGDLLVPDKWSTVMQINVQGNINTETGVIQIETDENGQIMKNAQDEYAITYLDCSSEPCETKILNPDLYTVKGGSILELRSNKAKTACLEHWEVNWNYDENTGAFTELIVVSDGEAGAPDLGLIEAVYLCPAGDGACTESAGSFRLVAGSGSGVYVLGAAAGITEGVYDLHIKLSTGEEIKGQVIYK